MDEKIFYCALNRIFGFQPQAGTTLIDAAGNAEAVFSLREDEIRSLIGNGTAGYRCINSEALDKAEEELQQLQQKGIRFIPCNSPEYPSLLKECPDAPIGLYVRGDLPGPGKDLISIVGTREISPYGIEWCRKIVEALASTGRGPVIVSGLALGTDITAHEAALEYGLPTLGVMATGADTIYPARHRKTGERICRAGDSGLVTDYPLATPPLPINFIRRNRIIAGLSRATIVIESRIRGGSMITARDAFGYFRDIYALPGRIDDRLSQGCNYMISNNMAAAIDNLDHLLESLSLRKPGTTPDMEERLEAHCSRYVGEDRVSQMSDILMAVKEEGKLDAGEIADRTGLPLSTVSKLAAQLESDGFISSDILGRYMINSKKM